MLSIFSLSIVGCEEPFDDAVTEVLGIYDANVVGVSPLFDLSVSLVHGDNIRIEALFDGDVWSVVDADLNRLDQFVKDIDIYNQSLGGGVYIKGEGFYSNGTIQLDYTMQFGNEFYDFTIIGSK
jgi:hypothetical protein